MDMLDRLGRLLRSFVPDDEAPYDPDLYAAWEELDEYLGEETERAHGPRGAEENRDPLAAEYRVLEVEPGASIEEVRESYKRLLRRYHPDRFVGRPEKQRAATEVTRAVIAAYRAIRSRKE
ncbi:MAG: J domain-containing protein [Alkalispirochaetaceae bacterium]